VFASTIGDDWEKVKKGTKGVIATCGSGMTAAMVGLGLEVVGAKSGFGLYDEVSLSYPPPMERGLMVLRW
jgi:thiosulfate/3-mercaptopyruvate sulfurtransferase